MTQKQLVIAGALAALAVLLYVGKATYPQWGARLRQSGNRQ